MKKIVKILFLFILFSISGCMLEYDGISSSPYYRDSYPRYYSYPYYRYPYFYYVPRPYFYTPRPVPRPHYGPRR